MRFKCRLVQFPVNSAIFCKSERLTIIFQTLESYHREIAGGLQKVDRKDAVTSRWCSSWG